MKDTDHSVLRHIQDSIIGQDVVIDAPFGPRKSVYCDFTASGRCLSFIEDYMRENVMPTYANTHSTTGQHAIQTGKFREDARHIIRKCVNANNDDAVLFTGSGTTAGIHKIAWALKINQKSVAEETVVFIGPYEHHSNILPWREYGTKVVRIQQVPGTGLVDLEQLQNELKRWQNKRYQLVVCISAASNVTGIITDVDAVSNIAHAHGALVIFDYAAAGPYLTIDMNVSKTAYKDAVILSPHKFVGGPGSPGLVIVKKWIFKNAVPGHVGGGTVAFVTQQTHAYVGNVEEREEGGTPEILGSIRAGMVFKLKDEVSTDLIARRDEHICRKAFEIWENNPCIYILGNHTAKRLPIFSFLTKHPDSGRLIHHNFISTLLSDLFGIQARGGCACAGPYAQDLLGMTDTMVENYLGFLVDNSQVTDNKWTKDSTPHVPMEIMKPGFTRINLAYFYDDATIDFVLKAVDMVTKYGWALLPQYTFDINNGSWKCISNVMAGKSLLTLADLSFTKNKMASDSGSQKNRLSYKDVFNHAEAIFRRARKQSADDITMDNASRTLQDLLPTDLWHLKWFLTPFEATLLLTEGKHEQLLDGRNYRLPFNLETHKNRTTPTTSTDISTHVRFEMSEKARDYNGYTLYRPSSEKLGSNHQGPCLVGYWNVNSRRMLPVLVLEQHHRRY